MNDPVCGNCGLPRSQHRHEDQDYCNGITNGDVFTSRPRDSILLGHLERKYPKFYGLLISEWMNENGHEV